MQAAVAHVVNPRVEAPSAPAAAPAPVPVQVPAPAQVPTPVVAAEPTPAPVAVTQSAAPSTGDKFRRVRVIRESSGYGLKITSHNEAQGVRISDITPGGAASRTGILRVGDIIVEVS